MTTRAPAVLTKLLVATQYNLELRGVRTRNTQRVMIKLQLKDSSGKQGFFFDIIDRQKCGDDEGSCLHVDDEFLRSARTKVWGKNDAKAFQTAKIISAYWVSSNLACPKKAITKKLSRLKIDRPCVTWPMISTFWYIDICGQASSKRNPSDYNW